MKSTKKLYRSHNKALGGVCAGLAEYFNLDISIVRILYLVISVVSAAFPGIIVYLIMWSIIPERP